MIIRKFLVVCVLVLGLFGNAIADLNSGLVAYYPFNGNSNDVSGNGNHGMVHGATLTSDRFGRQDRAYKFNGLNDYIQINDSNSLDLTKMISLVAWVKSNDITSNRYSEILRKTSNDSSGYLFSFQEFGNQLTIGINNDRSQESDTEINPTSLADGNWHFVVGTYNGSIFKIYRDGILVGSKSLGSSIKKNAAPLIIGSLGTTSEFFKGDIDEVSVYNRTLTEKEIQEIYTRNSIPSSSSCTSPKAITVSEKLDIQIPSLNYTSLLGTQNLWVNLKYYGKSPNGEILWKLKDFGTNP